jgi:ribonuclease VapC
VIIDTSAVIAILNQEPEAAAFVEAILQNNNRRLSAASYLEAGMVVDRSTDPAARMALDALLTALAITIEPVTVEQARIARDAHRTYGRGSGHAARLNHGDCFSYALAREKDEPILFKGTDFTLTDIRYAGRRADRHRLSELIPAYG